jgi:hypothetical protein
MGLVLRKHQFRSFQVIKLIDSYSLPYTIKPRAIRLNFFLRFNFENRVFLHLQANYINTNTAHLKDFETRTTFTLTEKMNWKRF